MIDYFFAAYFLWCIAKGYLNGIGKEVASLFISLLFLCGVMGVYLISELTGLIKTTLQSVIISTGFWISFARFLTASFSFFFIRGKVAKPLLELIVLLEKNNKPTAYPSEPFEFYE